MITRARGELPLAVAGRVYTLRLTVEACLALEAQTRQPFDRVCDRINEGRVTHARALLWAALLDRHAAMYGDPEVVGELIDQLGGPRAVLPILRELVALNTEPRRSGPGAQGRASRRRPADPWRALYVQARQAGVSSEAFWRLSLRELLWEMAVYRAQCDRETALAWWIAARVGQWWGGKLPKLETLLSTPPEPQSLEEQRIILESLSAQLGIPLRRVPRAGAKD